MAAAAPKTRKPKKASTPRKATRKRVESGNGHNGQVSVVEAQENYPALATVPPPEPDPEVVHPYGKNKPIYVFKPSDGSAPIVFPRIQTVPVTTKFMWKIYNLAEVFQSFEWMNLAGVPRDIQERVVDLPVVERTKFWAGWFNDATGPLDLSSDPMGPPGESSG